MAHVEYYQWRVRTPDIARYVFGEGGELVRFLPIHGYFAAELGLQP